jgi:hypothetical protein
LEKLPAARGVLLAGNQVALQGFSDSEVATLCQLLRRVIKNFDPNALGIDSEPPNIEALRATPPD